MTTVTATRSELRRGITDTLDLAWELLGRFPHHELTRIGQRHLDRHHSPAEPGSGGAGQ